MLLKPIILAFERDFGDPLAWAILSNLVLEQNKKKSDS